MKAEMHAVLEALLTVLTRLILVEAEAIVEDGYARKEILMAMVNVRLEIPARLIQIILIAPVSVVAVHAAK
jgi:hypothetical protein